MESKSVGIMVPGVAKGSSAFLLNLVKIQSSIFEKTHIIGRDTHIIRREIEDSNCANTYIHSIIHKDSKNVLGRTVKYLLLQVFMSY